jgi:hypothetical protein
MNYSENKYSKLVDFTALNGYYTIPILGLIGFCTNITFILVIFSPRFKDRNKFNYVIAKIAIETSGSLYFIGFQVKKIQIKMFF